MIKPAAFVSTLFFAMAAASHAQTPAPSPGTVEQVRAFADALDACTAGRVATTHPLMKSFVVEHSIAGATNSACAYSQTMPGKMTMECAFSAVGRKAMAAEIRKTVSGAPISGGTSQAAPEWAKECEVVTAAGARSPMVPPARGR